MPLDDHHSHPTVPFDLVPLLREFDIAANWDELAECPMCARAYPKSWFRARQVVLMRFSGLTVRAIARRLRVTGPAIRYHLTRAGLLTATSFEMHVSVARNRLRLSPRELTEAGATLSADETLWVAPIVNDRNSRRGSRQ